MKKVVLLLFSLLLVVCFAGLPKEEIFEFSYLPPLFNQTHKRAGYLNTDYLGAGYNIFNGNPITLSTSTGRDPGWITNKIISFSYSTGQQTTDGLYYVPDGATIQKINSCSYSAYSLDTYGLHSYVNNLATFASVSGGGPSGSFSLSAGYASTKAATTTQADVIIQTTATCQSYIASIYPFSAYTYSLTSAFLNDLANLPATYDTNQPGAFLTFFANWGTHISQQTVMGGRATSSYQFSSSSFNDLQSSSIDIHAAASASWGVYSGDAAASSSYATSSRDLFMSKSSSVTRVYLGPTPPMNPSNVGNWMSSVTANPFVMSYVLVPIHTLVASSSYSAKAIAIQTALSEFCAKTGSCENIANVPNDPTHVPSVSTCRMCASCGGNFPVEAGQRVNNGDWGAWDAYGANCGDIYTQRWDEVKLCCGALKSDPSNGMCKLCSSCGGGWNNDYGARINDGDWGVFRMWGSGCGSGYDYRWDPPHMCCQTQQCMFCDNGCGNGFNEVGRVAHNGDWGPWITYQGCDLNRIVANWDEAAVCCK